MKVIFTDHVVVTGVLVWHCMGMWVHRMSITLDSLFYLYVYRQTEQTTASLPSTKSRGMTKASAVAMSLALHVQDSVGSIGSTGTGRSSGSSSATPGGRYKIVDDRPALQRLVCIFYWWCRA